MSVDDIKNALTRGGTRFEENCRETIDLSLNQSQCSGRWLNCNFFFKAVFVVQLRRRMLQCSKFLVTNMRICILLNIYSRLEWLESSFQTQSMYKTMLEDFDVKHFKG